MKITNWIIISNDLSNGEFIFGIQTKIRCFFEEEFQFYVWRQTAGIGFGPLIIYIKLWATSRQSIQERKDMERRWFESEKNSALNS